MSSCWWEWGALGVSGGLWGSLGFSFPTEEEEEGGRGRVRGVQGIPALSAPALPWNDQKSATTLEQQTPRLWCGSQKILVVFYQTKGRNPPGAFTQLCKHRACRGTAQFCTLRQIFELMGSSRRFPTAPLGAAP